MWLGDGRTTLDLPRLLSFISEVLAALEKGRELTQQQKPNKNQDKNK